jgi:hypothetical protein
MEAIHSSDTSVTSTSLHGATSQKTAFKTLELGRGERNSIRTYSASNDNEFDKTVSISVI